MYMLMFAAAIRLRDTHPEVRRTYRVPAIRLVAARFRRFRRGIRVDFRETGWFHRFG